MLPSWTCYGKKNSRAGWAGSRVLTGHSVGGERMGHRNRTVRVSLPEKVRFKLRLEGCEWAKWDMGKSFQGGAKSRAKALRWECTWCVPGAAQAKERTVGLEADQEGLWGPSKDLGFCSWWNGAIFRVVNRAVMWSDSYFRRITLAALLRIDYLWAITANAKELCCIPHVHVMKQCTL